tara:strand:+ start:443 stop:607 length:165 start_codon:yes stop_codon:yes gene_type:complete
MPRGIVSKVDMTPRVIKMKNELYNGGYHNKSGDWHDGAHEMLNKILDMLNEYTQ